MMPPIDTPTEEPMPIILYTAASGARSRIDYTNAQYAAMCGPDTRAVLDAGGVLAANCGDPLGVVTVTRVDRPALAPTDSPPQPRQPPSATIRSVVADAQLLAGDCAGRIDAWAVLMAARGRRINPLRLWRMQATMPAITLLTGLAMPRHAMRPWLRLAQGGAS